MHRSMARPVRVEGSDLHIGEDIAGAGYLNLGRQCLTLVRS